VKEETNLDITLVKFVAYMQYIDEERDKDVLEIIFLGKIIQGEETHLNDPSTSKHIMNIEWMNYDDLCEKEFYPKDALEYLKSFLEKKNDSE
jgi:ADP-ribose pyrophosphatase YjhB (NUDIX family)